VFDDLYEIVRDPKVVPPHLLLRVHVQPGAGRTALMGRHGDALKIKVGAPPEGGRANAAVVSLVASTLGVADSQVTVDGGASSRDKRLLITGVEAGDLGRLLELAVSSGGGGAGSGGGGNARGAPGVTRHAP